MFKTATFTILKTVNTRGDDQWNIYRDGDFVAFVFDREDADRVIDEMTRFPVETRGNRFD